MQVYSLTTHNIKVEVITKYESQISKPTQSTYVHSYEVTIINLSSHSVQLLNRFWLITDGTNRSREVKGAGVIGKQPIIEPGKRHIYNSWSPIPTPLGKMSGHYEMKRLADDHLFQVEIPEFQLISDFKLN